MSSTTTYTGLFGCKLRSRVISSLTIADCTGLPPGLFIFRMTPTEPTSLNASLSAGKMELTDAVLLSLSISPSISTSAV